MIPKAEPQPGLRFAAPLGAHLSSARYPALPLLAAPSCLCLPFFLSRDRHPVFLLFAILPLFCSPSRLSSAHHPVFPLFAILSEAKDLTPQHTQTKEHHDIGGRDPSASPQDGEMMMCNAIELGIVPVFARDLVLPLLAIPSFFCSPSCHIPPSPSCLSSAHHPVFPLLTILSFPCSPS
ncbi:hypothetical protein HYV74_03395 [Candidatus Uhrbacteria bacterium]|nr:hypothetical protein [Candidatus Uhrbacteria bacterium]